MKLSIKHFTRYSFDQPVFFEPHYLRFRPRTGPHLKLLSYKTEIFPAIQGASNQFDPEGNLLQFCWFSGTHNSMEIKAESVVELQSFSPFEFLIHPSEFTSFPFEYSTDSISLLQPSLKKLPLNRELKEFTEQIAGNANHQTIPFLSALTREIFDKIKLETREKGAPQLPEKTFNSATGSCRDLSWLQINLLRHCGIAARFVSGYLFLDAEDPEYELHAWLEVYLPGAGWIGLDPSHGVFADQKYIPVAASADYKNTMPVTGSVRGDGKAKLQTDLVIVLAG